jgi:hypothetical protein
MVPGVELRKSRRKSPGGKTAASKATARGVGDRNGKKSNDAPAERMPPPSSAMPPGSQITWPSFNVNNSATRPSRQPVPSVEGRIHRSRQDTESLTRSPGHSNELPGIRSLDLPGFEHTVSHLIAVPPPCTEKGGPPGLIPSFRELDAVLAAGPRPAILAQPQRANVPFHHVPFEPMRGPTEPVWTTGLSHSGPSVSASTTSGIGSIEGPTARGRRGYTLPSQRYEAFYAPPRGSRLDLSANTSTTDGQRPNVPARDKSMGKAREMPEDASGGSQGQWRGF